MSRSRRSPCRRRCWQAGAWNRTSCARLVRRPALARRYLAVEGHRALARERGSAARRCPVADRTDVAARGGFAGRVPEAGARRAADIADPPHSFGVIKARQLLSARCRHRARRVDGRACSPTRSEQGAGRTRRRCGRRRASDVADSFSSPVGGGGVVGKLLLALDEQGAPAERGRPPGADAPTHRSRTGIAVRRRDVRSQPARPTPTASRNPRRRQEVSRVGHPSPALPARLVHGAGDRWTRCHEGPALVPTGRARAASAAGPARHRAGSLPPAGAGRRHRHRCRGRGAGRGHWQGRRPTRPSTSRACAGGEISPCSCSSTSRVPSPNPAPSARPCTSSSARRPPRYHRASRARRSRGAVRLSIAGSLGGAPGAGEAIRRHLDALVMRRLQQPHPGRLLAARCGDPPWRRR